MLRFRKAGQPICHPLVRVIHLSVHLSIHPPLDQPQYLLIMFHVLLGTKGITGERDTWSSALMELSV